MKNRPRLFAKKKPRRQSSLNYKRHEIGDRVFIVNTVVLPDQPSLFEKVFYREGVVLGFRGEAVSIKLEMGSPETRSVELSYVYAIDRLPEWAVADDVPF